MLYCFLQTINNGLLLVVTFLVLLMSIATNYILKEIVFGQEFHLTIFTNGDAFVIQDEAALSYSVFIVTPSQIDIIDYRTEPGNKLISIPAKAVS